MTHNRVSTTQNPYRIRNRKAVHQQAQQLCGAFIQPYKDHHHPKALSEGSAPKVTNNSDTPGPDGARPACAFPDFSKTLLFKAFDSRY